MEKYLAHIAEDGREQTLYDHLQGTADLCARFAAEFGAGKQGEYTGKQHDIGKASVGFQRRLHGGAKVDHSTAGAVESMKMQQVPAALCIAGHHAGLPDLGSKVLRESDSLWARINRAMRGGIETYEKWEESRLPRCTPLPPNCRTGLDIAFYTRMLYSCLVDADFLDTEAFMSNGTRITPSADFEQLNQLLDRYIAPWFPPRGELNQKRCKILRDCIDQGERLNRGLFTLTVPTGGGKTVASLAFALRHARQNGMNRIIYVIPYTSIIEQTAEVFREILGDDVVLEHHSGVLFDVEEASPKQVMMAKATENWDVPVVVTTAVQFFESLYANRSSKCRKLHSLANSVIVFDEAQMLPVDYLHPCVYAISQLVANYRASAVLCTATQPALAGIFEKFLPGQKAHELCNEELFYDPVFKRTRILNAGKMDWKCLADQLNEQKQTLCVVSSRKDAQILYDLLKPEGAYHLSTMMCPAHRKEVLAEIRKRLKDGTPCRVVSTSLIEAGVDVDFPTVFRERAGLDSILQAAGRCNREGKRSAENSIVTVFRGEGNIPPLFDIPVAAAEATMDLYKDLSTKEAVNEYFTRLLGMKGNLTLDRHNILKKLEGQDLPFATVAQEFKLIDNDTRTIYVPWKQGAELVQQLKYGVRSRALFRALGQYSVAVYEQHYKKLEEAGALDYTEDGLVVLADLSLYKADRGLSMEPESGQALFI